MILYDVWQPCIDEILRHYDSIVIKHLHACDFLNNSPLSFSKTYSNLLSFTYTVKCPTSSTDVDFHTEMHSTAK